MGSRQIEIIKFCNSYSILFKTFKTNHKLLIQFDWSGQSSESSSGDDNGEGDGGNKNDDAEVVIEDKTGTAADPGQGALAQVVVPDVFPEVPLLPVHRNPVFPRFVKMLEVRGCIYKHFG